jgi:hypothetical protein
MPEETEVEFTVTPLVATDDNTAYSNIYKKSGETGNLYEDGQKEADEPPSGGRRRAIVISCPDTSLEVFG